MKATSIPKADPFALFSTLQSWQLKHLAYLTGLNSTGTKPQLKQMLSTSLSNPMIPASKPYKILSVDMGVKNLAFCLLELRQNSDDSKIKTSHLAEWKRMDITQRLLLSQPPSSPCPITPPSSTTRPNPSPEPDDTSTSISPEVLNLYTPSSLSKIAYVLASSFLQHNPDAILIERQRFRSGGAPAIQEWTVRVNMLESMIWACLETLRHCPPSSPASTSTSTSKSSSSKETLSEERTFPDIHEMSPRRIGMFWLAKGQDATTTTPTDIPKSLTRRPKKPAPPTTTKKVDDKKKKSFDKKDKIALARGWLQDGCTLTVDGRLKAQVETFCSSATRVKGRDGVRKGGKGKVVDVDEGGTGKTVMVGGTGKLDDLADCLVQAVTFGVWEQNRMGLLEYVEKEGGLIV